MKIFNKIKETIFTRFSLLDSLTVFFFFLVSLINRFWMLKDISTHVFRGIPNFYGWMALWNCRVIDTLDFASYWTSNAMYPYPYALTFSESMMGFTPFIYPIWKITGNPVLTINILSILLLWISATITYFVLKKFNFDRFSSIIASLIFAFYPWILKLSSLGRFHMQGLIWTPIIVYANYKFWNTYKKKISYYTLCLLFVDISIQSLLWNIFHSFYWHLESFLVFLGKKTFSS